VITSFAHKGLKKFFIDNDYRGIPAQFASKIERILDRLDASDKPEDMRIPGLGFHMLTGNRQGYYSVTITGNWRITFRFDGEDAVDVDFEDYH
jgi:toxin HigB-1